MPLQRVPLNNFRGGLNTRDGPFDLQPNESPALQNVTLTALVGTLQVRAGVTRKDTNAPASPIDHAREFVTPAGTRFLMCSINGSIYSCDSTGAFTLRFTGTTGTVWDFAQMKNAANAELLYCANGVDIAQKWDGAAASTSAWFAANSLAGKRILVWRNRMVVLNSSGQPTDTILFSPVGDPENAIANYTPLQIRGDDDDQPDNVEMNVLADRLYVFKKRSTWVINDPVTLSNRRIGEPGCWDRFQSDVCEGKLYFFNEQGIWSTGGVAIEYESGSINNWFPQNLNFAALSKVRILATRDSYPRVLLAVPTGSSTTNNTMVELIPHINFRRIGGRRYLLLPAFMIHVFGTLGVASLANWKTTASGPWGVYGGGQVSKLYQYFNGSSDDGAAIVAYWQSSWMSIQGEEPFERIRRLNVELSGDCQVSVFKDFNSVADFVASVSSDSVWSGGTWSGGQWNTNQYRFVRVRPESRGRFHSIRFDALNPGAPFVINSAELAIRGGKEH